MSDRGEKWSKKKSPAGQRRVDFSLELAHRPFTREEMNKRLRYIDKVFKESVEKETAIRTSQCAFSTPDAHYEKVIFVSPIKVEEKE